MNAKALFSLYLHFFFTYFLTFSKLANHSRESKQRLSHVFCLSKWRRDFTQQRRHFSKNFQHFLSITVGPLLPIAGYFTSGTIMTVSGGNFTTFFIQRQETNEMQHSCFPTMGAINNLCARDLEISCQS